MITDPGAGYITLQHTLLKDTPGSGAELQLVLDPQEVLPANILNAESTILRPIEVRKFQRTC